MEWRDEGVLLSMRPHGEGSAIIEVFSAAHGRHLGVVRGGASRRLAPILQPGAQLDLHWRARLDAHIGAFAVEPLRSRAAVLSDPLALAGLSSTCALLHLTLPERVAHPLLYGRTIDLMDAQASGGDGWLAPYLRWEMLLLEEAGFGLDLATCAVTGARDDLAYVSPRTGRAVSRKGAGDWAARLLPLPQVLLGQGPATRQEALAALAVTGHFLAREIGAREIGARAPGAAEAALPEARMRLLARLAHRVPPG